MQVFVCLTAVVAVAGLRPAGISGTPANRTLIKICAARPYRGVCVCVCEHGPMSFTGRKTRENRENRERKRKGETVKTKKGVIVKQKKNEDKERMY
jgi:hypothetical protein